MARYSVAKLLLQDEVLTRVFVGLGLWIALMAHAEKARQGTAGEAGARQEANGTSQSDQDDHGDKVQHSKANQRPKGGSKLRANKAWLT